MDNNGFNSMNSFDNQQEMANPIQFGQNPNQNFGGYCTPNRGPMKMGQRPPINRGFNPNMGMGQGQNLGQNTGQNPGQNPGNFGQTPNGFDNNSGNFEQNNQGFADNQFRSNNMNGTAVHQSYVGSPLDKKGNLGVSFVILGIIAWLMVAGQLTTGLIIFAILCAFVEKDENLTKVMMSALTFMVTSYMIISGWSVIYNVLYYIVSGAASSSGWFSFMFKVATELQGALNSLNGLVSRIYDIVIFVIGLKSALAISRGQIIESKLVNKIFKIQ